MEAASEKQSRMFVRSENSVYRHLLARVLYVIPFFTYLTSQKKEVERRRRETINEGITELKKIVPGTEKNKGEILRQAVKYIQHLKDSETRNIEKWALEKLLIDQAMQDQSERLTKLSRDYVRLEAENESLKRWIIELGEKSTATNVDGDRSHEHTSASLRLPSIDPAYLPSTLKGTATDVAHSDPTSSRNASETDHRARKPGQIEPSLSAPALEYETPILSVREHASTEEEMISESNIHHLLRTKTSHPPQVERTKREMSGARVSDSFHSLLDHDPLTVKKTKLS